jgi:hypothetical protein
MKDTTMRTALTLVGLLTSVATVATANAQGPIPVPPAAATPAVVPPPPAPEPLMVPAAEPPPPPKPRRLEVGLSFLPMSLGKFSAVYGGMPITADAALAPGGVVTVGYEVIRGLLVGIAPQYLFNVGTKEDPSGAGNAVVMSRELDLMFRVKYAYEIVETIRLYAEVLPGYSLVLPANGDPAKGFVIAAGGGAAMDLGDRLFVNLGFGYQWGFQQRTDTSVRMGVTTKTTTDVNTDYYRIALGVGMRF